LSSVPDLHPPDHVTGNHRTGPYVRNRYGQDQLNCADSENFAWLACGVRRRIYVRNAASLRGDISVRRRNRNLGRQCSGRMGLRDYQLRLVDRNRPRGHADIGNPVASQARMAHVHQSVRRSDDSFRCSVRRPVPGSALGPAVVRVLADPVPEHDGYLASVSKPSRVGCVRGVHVCDSFIALLVCRVDSRSRHSSRSLQQPLRSRSLRHFGNGLERFGDPLASL
jgi:hypothetical protein